MSISKIQRERKIKEFSEELVKKGIEPNNYEINNMLREYFDNHIIGMPYYAPIKQTPYEQSSKDDYNHNFETFREDIETAYQADIEANNKAVSIQEYYDTEKSLVLHAIDKIVLRANNLQESLKTNKKIQEYVEVFDNLYGLEMYGNEERNLPYTTSFIDLLQKKVYTEKTNSQINRLSIENGSVTLGSLHSFSSYNSQGDINNILNDTFSDVFIFTGRSEQEKEQSLEVFVDLGAVMTFNTVLFKTTSSNDMSFNLAISEDGNDYTTVYSMDGKDLIEWNFEPQTARYLKMTITKKQADGYVSNTEGLNIYEYYYILKNISIANETFEQRSVFVTKPIEFNNLTNFIKLDAKDITFANTKINYFIGFDNNTNKIGWDAIENHKEHELFMFEKQHKIANYGTYKEYGTQSDLTGLYQVFKLPDGVNTNSLKVTPGYNMWEVKRYNRIDGDYDDGFDLKDTDVTEYIKNCTMTRMFMDCEKYFDFEIKSNTLYIFTQYVTIDNDESIYDNFIKVTDNAYNETGNSVVRLFVNGYEQITGDNGRYNIHFRKGTNKIQFVVYSPSSTVETRMLYHNINFKKLTNNVFAFKPMKYTNVNMLTKSLEPTYEYYTIKNNIVYVNIDPSELIHHVTEDMGYFLSYYSLKPDMQKFFSNNKLRFRIMGILTSTSKNVSPEVINFSITGK